MDELRLTPDQRLAVNTRGCSLLVSAAAGSGKTRVLVERLMAYMTDPDDPRDIDSFLVITYTRAAAAELKSRIMEGVNGRAALEPGNRRLRRQAALCCRAHIGTIHSFCTSLLRENCHLAAIAPDFRVADEDRAARLKSAALDALLERRYEEIDTDAGFRELVDTVGAGRDDSRLSALILELHEKLRSHAWPEEWAREQEKALELGGISDLTETVWGRELLENAGRTVSFWLSETDALVAELASLDEDRAKIAAAYLDSLSQTRDALFLLRASLNRGWDAARQALPVPFPRLGALRNSPDPELSERIKAVRDACKKAMEKLSAQFAESSESLIADMRATAPAMRSLLELTLELDSRFSAEKRRRGLVDFQDLEHLALGLLYDREKGGPTKLAKETAGRFTEIMVDEYQDVNRVQDLIFRCVSREGNNLFMVGDVKQSVYRFRLADPGIFLDRYRELPDAENAGEGQPRRVLLRENFRSRGCVLDAANHLFGNLMSRELGELDYDENAALRRGADYYPEPDVPVSFEIIEAPESVDGGETPERTETEARHVAGRIKRLVASGAPVTEGGETRPVDYGDIVILLRSPGSSGGAFRLALAEAGIPTASEQGDGFFTSAEVSTMLSLLAVIDDPHQDVPLISVLRSPLFGFSANELSAVRAADMGADFYGALVKRAETDEKSAGFLNRLGALRALSPDLSPEELLRYVYTETDTLALFSAMPDGAARRANLMLLLEYARKFGENGYRGLFRFNAWLRRLAERGEEPVSGAAEGGAVRIMSIHKSKGLEFPYVFIPDTARRFNRRDTASSVLVHAQLGLGPKLVDGSRRVEYPTAARRAVAARITRETLSEEMRVLYVGATRAKERLFFSCVWKKPEERLKKLALFSRSPLSPELLIGDSSFSDWIARCCLLENCPIELVITAAERAPEAEARPDEAEPEAPAADEERVLELSRKLAFSYPYAQAAALPSKLTATEAKGRTEAPDDGEGAAELPPAPPPVFRRPELGQKHRGLSPAERGVAAHLVMQHLDFSRAAEPGGVSREIARLRECGCLSGEQARAVDPRIIERFFASGLGRRVLGADRVWREFKFSLLCPAGEFFRGAGDEKLLLQGIVDCCIEENGALTVIDYKTDFVTRDTIAARAESYRGQLRAYAAALERILKKPVRETALYFLTRGEAVSLGEG